MKQNKYFTTRVKITNPEVIIRKKCANNQISYVESYGIGRFYLVKPVSQREVLFIAGLEHNLEKFAPKISKHDTMGEGILISEAAMALIDA